MTENTIQSRPDNGNPFVTLTNPMPGDPKSVEPGLGGGIAENTIQPRYDDDNTHSTLTNQVDINSGLLQTPPAPVDHQSVEPVVGGGISEITVQPWYDFGETHSTLNNQVDIDGILQIPAAAGEANAPLAVANQAQAMPSVASPIPPSSGGSPSGFNSANDRAIGILPKPEGNGVQSVSPGPVLFTSEFTTSPSSGPGYSIHDYVAQGDVDWRNLNPAPLSNSSIQNIVHKDGYDPNRIPASVFNSKPASSMDWSNASNESLFSIYTGNSFSGYQGMFMSGEFGKIEQPNKSQNPFETFEAKANEGTNFSPDPPTLPKTSVELERQQIEHIKDDITIGEGVSNRSINAMEESKENHGDIRMNEGLSERSTTTTEESKGNYGDSEMHEGLLNSSISSTSESNGNYGNNAYHEENVASDSISPDKEGFSTFEATDSSPNRLSNDSGKSGSSINRQSEESCGSFAFPVLVADPLNSSSFKMRSEMKQQQQQQQQQQQIKEHTKQQSESPSPKTETTQSEVKNRGCLSWFTGWQRCW